MPKYHFEIVDGFTLEDPVGLDCRNDVQAKTVAKDIARQIAEDLGGKDDRRVVVRDDDGAEVYETAIRNQQRPS
ncbi:hypothetical protein RPMA_13950 [Tardiphaga alba]|uniref:DUF6894 domain-containing protein n=1 Tax=Tardiphaga alba TaxID=340268 RepID=A0ABX8ABQ2_9BRAD|nr:hypothetical protein [Tardiphaga alba]QUS39820.1 hypothetical protein RPMA_13950 [Tardiphaga alba]